MNRENMMRRFLLCILGVLFFSLIQSPAHAQDESEPGVQFKWHGLIAMEVGQIVKGIYRSNTNYETDADHIWQEKLLLRIGGELIIGDRFNAIFLGQGVLAYPYPIVNLTRDFQLAQPARLFYPLQGEGIYSFLGDPKAPFAQAAVGFFPYKYNPDVKNLGEFLFRTSTYPLYFNNDFDFPRARMLGIRLSGNSQNLFSAVQVKMDALFFSELEFYPTQGWGLAGIASCTILKGIEIGGGISGHNLFSVYNSMTGTGFDQRDLITPHHGSYFIKTDSSTVIVEGAPTTIYDTTFYSFKGLKAMARLAFDPKVFFNSSLFGPNDLRVYAEACLVGIANQGEYYKYPENRIPVAFGINLPGFKVIDMVNVEFEYLNTDHPLNWTQVYRLQLPIPVEATSENDLSYTRNPWKWSIFIEKRFLKHIGIKAQVSRDHYVPKAYTAIYENRGEFLKRWNDWMWMLKTEVSW
jgi:hypothetical protein